MIPILYSKAETVAQLVADKTNGVGRLADATSCKVQEDRNGAFTLSMTYPISGIHYADIVIGGCINAKQNELADPQLFRIYHISKPLNGMVTIDAQHLSYDLSKAVVKPFSAKGITAVTSGMISNMIGGIGFSFSSDINNGDSQFTNDHPQSFRALLGGQEGSVLDVFGGEYEFNNEKVILHAHRGSDNGVVIRYGKNLTSVQQDENIESTYTAVYPYVLNSDQETIAGDLQTVVSTSEPKILALDLSSEFKEEDGTPTAAQINAKAQEYIKANNIGVPKVSLDVSFVQLWQTQEYKEIAPLERVSLCDTVTVKYEKLGVDAKAKVITTVYDVLAERYDSITLGDAKSSLASTIAAAPDRNEIQKQASSDLERAVTRATNLITGQKGGHVVIKRDANGKPQELLIMDTEDEATATKVWRWNLSGLGYSSKGINGEYGTAITQDGEIVADFITTGDLNAQVITTGILKDRKGNNYWNLDTGDFRLSALTNYSTTEEMSAAIKASSDKNAAELSNFITATYNRDITDLQNQIDGNISTWYYTGVPTLTNIPASQWTTKTDKDKHIGDLYYDKNTGYVYRFMLDNSVYKWIRITDEDIGAAMAAASKAQDTADGKRRVFVTQPVPPYDKGDLWCSGSSGDILTCMTAKASGESYATSDWRKLNKYTDDSALSNFITATYNRDITDLQNQIDGNISTWYYTGVPTLTNIPASQWTTKTDKDKHIGDLYYDKNTGYVYRFMLDNSVYKWIRITDEDIGAAMAAASKAQDTADGKRRVFVTQPVPPYDKGDLWCSGSSGDILTCMTAKASGESYATSDWRKLNKYTDDSAVKALDNKLNSSEEIFNRLTNNGTVQGITMQDGNLYINAAYILAGVLAGFTLDFNLENNPTRLDGGHYSMYDYVDGETKTIYGLFVHAKNDTDEYKNALIVNGAFNFYSRDLPARLAVSNEHHLDIQFGSTKRHINNRGTAQTPRNPGLYIANDTGGSCYIDLTEDARLLIHADNGIFVNDTQPVRGPLSHLVTCQYNNSTGCLEFLMDGKWVGSTKK